jgi:polar amino acid transport system substrate-binding protein
MDFTSAIWSCYRCMPVRGVSGSSCPPTADSKQLLLDSTSDAAAALKADRGVAFAEDSTLLLGLTLKDPSLKVVGDDKAETPWGIGIKQGDQAAKQYVDAVLADLQAKDKLWEIFGSVVTDPKARDAFAKNMPRPGRNIVYTDEDTLTDCSRLR